MSLGGSQSALEQEMGTRHKDTDPDAGQQGGEEGSRAELPRPSCLGHLVHCRGQAWETECHDGWAIFFTT